MVVKEGEGWIYSCIRGRERMASRGECSWLHIAHSVSSAHMVRIARSLRATQIYGATSDRVRGLWPLWGHSRDAPWKPNKRSVFRASGSVLWLYFANAFKFGRAHLISTKHTTAKIKFSVLGAALCTVVDT